ncbi:Uncharacterised protein [Shigella flexneri]|nr:Uncharacterised protein [Shigella flexneri]
MPLHPQLTLSQLVTIIRRSTERLFSFVCNLNRSPVNIPIIELIIFTLFVFPLTIILFRALSHGNSIVFINF